MVQEESLPLKVCQRGMCPTMGGVEQATFWSKRLDVIPLTTDDLSERNQLRIVAGFNPEECKNECLPGVTDFLFIPVSRSASYNWNHWLLEGLSKLFFCASGVRFSDLICLQPDRVDVELTTGSMLVDRKQFAWRLSPKCLSVQKFRW